MSSRFSLLDRAMNAESATLDGLAPDGDVVRLEMPVTSIAVSFAAVSGGIAPTPTPTPAPVVLQSIALSRTSYAFTVGQADAPLFVTTGTFSDGATTTARTLGAADGLVVEVGNPAAATVVNGNVRAVAVGQCVLTARVTRAGLADLTATAQVGVEAAAPAPNPTPTPTPTGTPALAAAVRSTARFAVPSTGQKYWGIDVEARRLGGASGMLMQFVDTSASGGLVLQNSNYGNGYIANQPANLQADYSRRGRINVKVPAGLTPGNYALSVRSVVGSATGATGASTTLTIPITLVAAGTPVVHVDSLDYAYLPLPQGATLKMRFSAFIENQPVAGSQLTHAVAGLPTGITATFASNPQTPDGGTYNYVTFAVGAGVPDGAYPYTLTATLTAANGTASTGSVQGTLDVGAGKAAYGGLAYSGFLAAVQGTTASVRFPFVPPDGMASAADTRITANTAGLPSGVAVTLPQPLVPALADGTAPNDGNGAHLMRPPVVVDVAPSVAPGTYTFTVTASTATFGGVAPWTATYTLAVVAADATQHAQSVVCPDGVARHCFAYQGATFVLPAGIYFDAATQRFKGTVYETTTPSTIGAPADYVVQGAAANVTRLDTGAVQSMTPEDAFQHYLRYAAPGKIIQLPTTYTLKPANAFVLYPKGAFAGQYVIVRGGDGTGLPQGQWSRASAAQHGQSMGTVQGTRAPSQAIRAIPGASCYWFEGVNVVPTLGMAACYGMIELTGAYDANGNAVRTLALTDRPHHIVFNKCAVNGDPSGVDDYIRAFSLGGQYLAVQNCEMLDIVAHQDSQCVNGNSGQFIKIANNSCNASGENIMWGGSDPLTADLHVRDIEHWANYLWKKPVDQQNLTPTPAGYWPNPAKRGANGNLNIKATSELKIGWHILQHENVSFHPSSYIADDNEWHTGSHFTYKSLVQGEDDKGNTNYWDCRAQSVRQVVTWRNHVQGGTPFNTTEYQINGGANPDSRPYFQGTAMRGLAFGQNYVADWGDGGSYSYGVMGLLWDTTCDQVFAENTLNPARNGCNGDLTIGDNVSARPDVRGFQVFADNLMGGSYAILDGTGALSDAKLANGKFPRFVVRGNGTVNPNGSNGAVAGIKTAASVAAAGFVNAAAGDFTLAAGSPFKAIAANGADPGGPQAAVKALKALVIAGTPA